MQHAPEVRWEDLRLLLALFRERSLARAGQRLAIDASTASRRLAFLEQQLAVRLFDRTRDGLRATAAAERLIPIAERMEACASEFGQEASGFERAIEGRVRVSAPPGIADVFLADAVPLLAERHPAIVLEIDSRIKVADLSRREADIALRMLEPVGTDLVQKHLMRTRATLLGSPRYVEELGTLEHFADARYVMFGAVLSKMPQYAWIRKHIPESSVALVSDSYSCQLRAAAAGAGLVFAAETFAAAFDLRTPKMSRAVAAAMREVPGDDLWLVGHRALREVPRVAAVWAFLSELFSGADEPAKVRARMRRTQTHRPSSNQHRR